MLSYVYAFLCICFPLYMLSVVYTFRCICFPLYMLSVVYAFRCICFPLYMLSIVYAFRCICFPLYTLSFVYASLCVCFPMYTLSYVYAFLCICFQALTCATKSKIAGTNVKQHLFSLFQNNGPLDSYRSALWEDVPSGFFTNYRYEAFGGEQYFRERSVSDGLTLNVIFSQDKLIFCVYKLGCFLCYCMIRYFIPNLYM